MSSSLRPPAGQRVPLVYASQRALDQWTSISAHGRPLECVVRDLIWAGRLYVGRGVVVGDGFEAVVVRRASALNRNRKSWFVMSVRPVARGSS